MNEGFVPGFFAGIQALVTGCGLLAEPGMRRYAILPLILSVLAFVVLVVLAVFFFGDLAGWVRDQLPGWLLWTVWLLWIALAAAFVFGFYFTFTMMVGLVGLPIFMLLANEVERRMTGRLPESHRGVLYLTWIGFWRQFPRFLYLGIWLAVILVATLVLFFIPLVNFLIAPMWFLFGSWAFSVMMSDFPLGARDLAWPEQRALIKRYRGRVLGLGVASGAMALIPVLNLILLAAATAGVTVAWIEVLEE
ncbi:MAG: EI24 domain-containing protein [Gammaproteobacteria bacterium]|nr:EI24 domain-containing protein [Gammaproteobacteria bacterium]